MMTPRPLPEVEDELPPKPDSLTPSEEVSTLLKAGFIAQREERFADAGNLYDSALTTAQMSQDRAGIARAFAQRASLAEKQGETEPALDDLTKASELFLEFGDGAGLVQTYRLEGLLQLRRGEIGESAGAFARALALALQLDAALVFTTLNQMIPAARHLIEAGKVADLLRLAGAMQSAIQQVEAERGSWPDAIADVVEIVTAVTGLFASLGVLAEEQKLASEQRRKLAARATHQAWMVDALTRRRWGLADLVKSTLSDHLDFHEEVD